MCKVRNVKFFRIVLALAVLLSFSLKNSLADGEDRNPLFFMGFSGTNNDPGWLFKLDTTAGYQFNRHFEITAGLPVYFVQVPGDTAEEGFTSKNGIGNFYIDLRVMVPSDTWYFSSSVRGTAPTGDKEEGFSTGHGTFEWSNYLEYSVGNWTPFGSVGIANSISDTHFFTRPFTSFGLVGQFEGGLMFDPAHWISIAGSGYAVIPSGEQEIYSRLYRYGAQESGSGGGGAQSGNGRRGAFEDSGYTVIEADDARDHGFSGWVDIYPQSNVALELGYSRSVSYEYNTLFFSARFDIGGMLLPERD